MGIYLNDKVTSSTRPELGIGIVEKRWPWGLEVKFADETVAAGESELQKVVKRAKEKKRPASEKRLADRLEEYAHVLSCLCEYCIRFRLFHAANPHVFEFMLKTARADLDAGITHGTVEYLWQTVRRANLDIVTPQTVDGEGMSFKLEDHHRTRYTRLLCLTEPKLLTYFKSQKMDCQLNPVPSKPVPVLTEV